MSQLVPTPNATLVAPALTEEAFRAFGSTFDTMFANMAVQGRYLKCAADGLHVTIGDNTEILPYNGTSFVCLGANPYRHCVWYQTAYQAGREDKPTLLWLDRGDGTFPEELPVELKQKVKLANGKLGWAYQIKQRTVWALIRTNADNTKYIDFENYLICDLPSTTLFGKEEAKKRNTLTWIGVGQYCQQLSSKLRCPVHPAMFETQFVQGAQAGVFFFRLSPQMFGAELLLAISQWLTAPEIQKAIEIQEILHIESDPTSYVPPTPSPVQFATVNVPASNVITPPTIGTPENVPQAPQEVVQPVQESVPLSPQPMLQPQPQQPAFVQAAQYTQVQPAPQPQTPIDQVVQAVNQFDFSSLKSNLNILKDSK